LVTLSELLSKGGLAKGRVVAGKDYLSNIVTWLHVLESPSIVDWMAPGELVITNLYSLIEKPDMQRELIRRMKDAQAAGIIIKVRRWVEDIPKAIFEEAENCGLPIIELPPEVSYHQVMQPVYTILLNQQLELLERSEQIHRSLTEVIVTGGEIDTLCATISELVANPVLIFDSTATLIAEYGANDCKGENLAVLDEYFTKAISEGAQTKGPVEIQFSFQGRPVDALITPAVAGEELWGFLMVLQSGRPIDNLDRKTMEHGVLILALLEAKIRSMRIVESRLKGNFLHDLLAGKAGAEEQMIYRSQALGLDLTASLTVAVFSLPETTCRDISDEETFRLCSRILEQIIAEVSAARVPAIFNHEGLKIIALFETEGQSVPRLVEACIKRIRRSFPSVELNVGIGGNSTGSSQIIQSYEDALQVLRVGKKLSAGKPGIYTYENLRIYCLLDNIASNPKTNIFISEKLGALIEYDKTKGNMLVPTMEEYFSCHRNAKETAARLYIHRHTLSNRLRQIEEITGLSFDNPENFFVLELLLHLIKLKG